MSYSGAGQAKNAREDLGKALARLQEDPEIPKDVLEVAQNIAQAVGALFQAENAEDDSAGKGKVRNALGSLSQTMALLQDVRSPISGIEQATATIAGAMKSLHPLTVVPSQAPPPMSAPPAENLTREKVEANLGASSETNFYMGFSNQIHEGGVFVATYNVLAVGTPVDLTITMPGGFEVSVQGTVHFVSDPQDMFADSEPGMGVRFDTLQEEQRQLIKRFIAKRAPMFYSD